MNFYTALLILPSVACFFWIVVHSLMASRVSTFRVLIFLLITVGLVIVTDDSDLLFANTPGAPAISKMILQLAAPSVIPLLMLYLDHLGRNDKYHPVQLVWIIIPAVLFTAAGVLTYIIGVGEVEEFLTKLRSAGSSVVEDYRGTLLFTYYGFTKVALRVVVYAELAVYLVFIFILSKRRQLNYRRAFASAETGVTESQVVCGTVTLLIVMTGILSPGDFVVRYMYLGALWAVLSVAFIFIFCYVALFGAREYVSAANRSSAWRFNYSSKNKAALLGQIAGDMAEDADEAEMETILSKIGVVSDIDSLKAAGGNTERHNLAESIFSAVSKSWSDQSLLSRFQHLMVDEQLFLQPGLTLVDVAERLHSNKTYVSKMVNQACNLTFPEFLNIMRIDYAEQYITSHRDANQNEVARACGFVSASSFNTTFKRITGYTPKVWAARESAPVHVSD